MYLRKAIHTLLVCCLALAALPPPDDLVLNFRNNDGTRQNTEFDGLRLAPNQRAHIQAFSNPSTGYRWTIEEIDNGGLFRTTNQFHSNARNDEV